MKFILIIFFCVLMFFGCEDTKNDSNNTQPQYSTVKGFVYDSATLESAYNGYSGGSDAVQVFIGNANQLVNLTGYYELPNIETGTQIVIALGRSYKTFRDTIQVSGTEFLYDIYLEKE